MPMKKPLASISRCVNNTPMSRRLILSLLFSTVGAMAADLRNELPAPSTLQAVALKNAITLTWQWSKPEALPAFSDFGYEVKRRDGKTILAKETSYTDQNLRPRSYSYTVRARGTAKVKGKRVTYVSDWSEPAEAVITENC